jgi:nucleoredoxin
MVSHMFLRTFAYLYTLCILVACSASSDENELRTWIDVQGRTMQAELIDVDLDANEVVFLKDTGRRYRFQINQLCEADQKYIRAKKDTLTELVEPVAEPRTDFEKAICKSLVRFSGGRMKRILEADLSAKDYYAIYYSAHWCPPCRKFTPQLISFYNSYSKKHDNFEIIFVSSDRSEDKMENYMKTTNMPWPALAFDKTQTSHAANRYSGNGIPCLVLLDNKGNVLANSYVGGVYTGPTAVMHALKEKLD